MIIDFLTFVCGLMGIGVLYAAYRFWEETRRRANKSTLTHLNTMFDKWDVLLDAKLDNDSDVPDAVVRLGEFMVNVAVKRTSPWLLLSVVRSSLNGSKKTTAEKELPFLREPLDEVFHEFFHAWFICVSNQNLLARALIRQVMGRGVFHDEEYDPYGRNTVRLFADMAKLKGGAMAA